MKIMSTQTATATETYTCGTYEWPEGSLEPTPCQRQVAYPWQVCSDAHAQQRFITEDEALEALQAAVQVKRRPVALKVVCTAAMRVLHKHVEPSQVRYRLNQLQQRGLAKGSPVRPSPGYPKLWLPAMDMTAEAGVA